jgi:hypothetical protein
MINKQMCKRCGGLCCKEIPGEYFPEQLGDSPEEVHETAKMLLKTGYFTLRPYIGKGDVTHALSPITHESDDTKYGVSWGVCVFWRPCGCKLKREQRPQNCNDLIPSVRECYYIDNKKAGERASERWRGYELYKVLREINDE